MVKPCRVEGCDLPKERPSHHCAWHALAREPIDVQVAASKVRLGSVPEEDRLARVPDILWPPGFRWCAGCQSMVPSFYTQGSRCTACASAAAHGAMIERTYDLTADEYAALLELQGGRCAICRRPAKSIRLAVDHDHDTGAVRGLLHSSCNHDLLGAAHDNADMLRAALHYLEHPPMSGEWTPPTVQPRTPARGRRTDPAANDPTYLMFDHEPGAQPLPSILDGVRKRMTIDQLVLSGGRSDPEADVYWLAYRRAVDEDPPW